MGRVKALLETGRIGGIYEIGVRPAEVFYGRQVLRPPGQVERHLGTGEVSVATRPVTAQSQVAIRPLHNELLVPGRGIAIDVLVIVVETEQVAEAAPSSPDLEQFTAELEVMIIGALSAPVAPVGSTTGEEA